VTTDRTRTTGVLSTVTALIRLILIIVCILAVVALATGGTDLLDRLPGRGLAGDDWAEANVVFARDGATPEQRRQLRSRLQSQLAHHATLSIRFMRATVSGDPGFVDAANDVLVRNVDELRATLEPAIGGDRAARFAAQWSDTSQQLFAYAKALRDDDDVARQKARDDLDRSVAVLAEVLAEATGGQLGADIARTKLQMQTDLLLFQIDAYDDHDHSQAYELEREAFANMYPLGAAIAAAATGRDPSATSMAPREETASRLALLFDEHVELSIDTLRAGTSGAPEFAAAAAALDANTADLRRATVTLLGARRARTFNQRWTRHIDLLMRYTVAVAEGDLTARTTLQRRLDDTMRGFGPALAKATGGRVGRRMVANAMTAHEFAMIDHISAYVATDYERAHDTAYDAYSNMNQTAHRIGRAVGGAVEAGLPQGGAATGGGGTADVGP
jgi:hypothetical protein